MQPYSWALPASRLRGKAARDSARVSAALPTPKFSREPPRNGARPCPELSWHSQPRRRAGGGSDLAPILHPQPAALGEAAQKKNIAWTESLWDVAAGRKSRGVPPPDIAASTPLQHHCPFPGPWGAGEGGNTLGEGKKAPHDCAARCVPTFCRHPPPRWKDGVPKGRSLAFFHPHTLSVFAPRFLPERGHGPGDGAPVCLEAAGRGGTAGASLRSLLVLPFLEPLPPPVPPCPRCGARCGARGVLRGGRASTPACSWRKGKGFCYFKG